MGGDAELVWVDAGFLQDHDVAYWAGPRSLPLWLPEDALGLAAHDVSAAVAAGLTTRPIADTAATPSTGCARRKPPPAPASPGPRNATCSTSGTRCAGEVVGGFQRSRGKPALPVRCNVREVQVSYGKVVSLGPQ